MQERDNRTGLLLETLAYNVGPWMASGNLDLGKISTTLTDENGL